MLGRLRAHARAPVARAPQEQRHLLLAPAERRRAARRPDDAPQRVPREPRPAAAPIPVHVPPVHPRGVDPRHVAHLHVAALPAVDQPRKLIFSTPALQTR